MLKGKKILLGITAGIAAYKIPFLIRLLIKEGAEVKVLMTKEACNFVTPLTLSTLSQNPVSIEPFDPSTGAWHSHIELGSWADVMVLAPLTANSMAKMANGITDNLLTATYLAARCPVFFAPSMDVDMFNHPTAQKNIGILQSYGNHFIAPHSGELASGLTGMGRLEEPENIVKILKSHFAKKLSLSGKRILITSGPTLEAIDPVRFISNHSSGKMGNALALEAAERGALVTLVSGPVASLPCHPSVKVIKVTSAEEMFQSCVEHFPKTDICVMAAAVADYTPSQPLENKLKKGDGMISISFTKTKDILYELGRQKTEKQLLIGFALETENEIANARQKLHTKNLDFIVLNSLKNQGAGFGFDTNQVSIIDKENHVIELTLKSKKEIASEIFDIILKSKE